MDAPRSRALRKGALLAGALAIAAAAYAAGARQRATTAPAVASSAPRTSIGASDLAGNAAPAAGLPAAHPVAAPDGVAAGSVAIMIPLPARLGGGNDVPPSTRVVAQRLGLVPEELHDVALARGGSLSPPIVQSLDDAYGKGLTFAQQLAIDPQKDDVVANRFANQLVRIDREMRRSPPGTKLDEIVAAVTRDTLEDLSRNVDPTVADAAKPLLAALRPLPPD